MDHKAAARLANAAYKGEDVDGYVIDKAYSNRNRTLYVDPETNKAVLAFAGTRLNSKKHRWGDIGSDALIALGLQSVSSRFRNAKKSYKSAREKYEDLQVVGHSAGGSQALYLNSKYAAPTVAFNPGISLPDSKKSLMDKLTSVLHKGRRTKSNATIYHVPKDPISMLSPTLVGANTKVVKVKQKKGKSAHAMDNFLD
jgi:hypothetical protein